MEPIGFGFGAVSFAGELAKSVIALKQLWDEVQDVPEDILQMLEALEGVDQTFQNFEEQIDNNEATPEQIRQRVAVSGALLQAKSAHAKLKNAVNLLNKEIQNRKRTISKKYSSLKVVLKKPTIEKLRDDLDWTLKLLQLALTCYSASGAVVVAGPSPPICGSGITRGIEGTSTRNETSGDNSREYSSQEMVMPSNRKSRRGARTILPSSNWFGRFSISFTEGQYDVAFQAPTWLAGAVYTTGLERNLHGWQVNLRAISVINEWNDFDKILDATKQDDPSALFRSLQRARLPLLTRDGKGFTLLNLASEFGGVKIFRELLAVGLDSYVWDHRLPNQFEYSMDYWIFSLFTTALKKPKAQSQRVSAKQMMDILEMLLPYDKENRIGSLQWFANLVVSTTMFDEREFARRFLPNYSTLPVQDRLQCTRSFLCNKGTKLQLLKFLLPEAWPATMGCYELSSPEVVAASRETQYSLIHSMAMGLGTTYASTRSAMQLRKVMIGESVHIDPASLHWQERDSVPESRKVLLPKAGPQTPFFTFLRAVLYQYADARKPVPWHKAEKEMQASLRTWLEALEDIDLRKYGREERRLYFDNIYVSCNMKAWVWRLQHRIHLTGFTYGPKPGDWILWWADEYEEYAGDFWNMVENPPQEMPGKWVEDVEEPEMAEARAHLRWVFENNHEHLTWAEIL